MSSRTQALLNTINEIRVQKTQAQLSAMSAKINPHFLYNQLDAINWIAIRNEDTEVSKALHSLARFYRASLAEGREIVTIGQELMHLNNYIELTKMRTKDAVVYTIHCDEPLKDYLICSMVLQPLMENAIMHGIMEKEDPRGTVILNVSESETELYITIIDDGVGIPDDELLQLNEGIRISKSQSGYGAYNVTQRIRIYFGAQYGLRYRVDGGRTIAEINLPKRLEEA